MMAGQQWFWTPERLAQLRSVLDELCQEDDRGKYFGPKGLSRTVARRARRRGFIVYETQIGNGLKILMFFGLLEAGRRGTKAPDYKRRYFPNAHGPITEANLNAYRLHVYGVSSPLPPR